MFLLFLLFVQDLGKKLRIQILCKSKGSRTGIFKIENIGFFIRASKGWNTVLRIFRICRKLFTIVKDITFSRKIRWHTYIYLFRKYKNRVTILPTSVPYILFYRRGTTTDFTQKIDFTPRWFHPYDRCD